MAIFEQIGKRLTDAGQGATQQAKNFAEITRLNGVISDKEKRISQIYTEIGRSYYEEHKDDPQAEGLEHIAEINGLNAEILQCRESIKLIKGVTKCPNCGADVPLNAVFCNACGAKIIPAVRVEDVSVSQPMLLCPECRKPVPTGDLFCSHCGAKIENN